MKQSFSRKKFSPNIHYSRILTGKVLQGGLFGSKFHRIQISRVLHDFLRPRNLLKNVSNNTHNEQSILAEISLKKLLVSRHRPSYPNFLSVLEQNTIKHNGLHAEQRTDKLTYILKCHSCGTGLAETMIPIGYCDAFLDRKKTKQ